MNMGTFPGKLMGSWDIIVKVMTKPNTWGAIGVTTMGITMVINPQKMGYVAATKTLLTPLIGGTPPPMYHIYQLDSWDNL